MKHRIKFLLISVVLAGQAATTFAQSNIYVATNGDDAANSGQSWASPYATISNGVAHAPTAGDTVWVSNGIYNLTVVVSVTNGITVQSANGPDYTFANGRRANQCFYLEHTNAVLSGFSITNGYFSGYQGGGGGTCWKGLVTNCTISGCEQSRANYFGGGIYVGGTGTIVNCIVSNNVASYGGGVYLAGTMKDCTIVDNVSTTASTYYGGAGVWMVGGSVGTNCTIIDNTTTSGCGGGLSVQGGTLWDSTISRNWAMNGGGLSFNGGGTLRNCTISGNGATNGGSGGGGVFSDANGGGTLINCTISCNTNFDTDNYGGGGIYAWLSITVTNCVITGNVSYAAAGQGAGGAYLRNNNCVLRNSLIIRNRAAGSGTSRAGGIKCELGGTVRECEIKQNTAVEHAAGVQMYRGGRLINCLITANVSSDNGGGLTAGKIGEMTGYISSCTIVSNKAVSRGGIHFNDLTYDSPVTNCIVYLNTATSGTYPDIAIAEASTNYFWYSCVPVTLPVNQGNITNNPQFVDTNTNYRLAKDSPCANAGTNQSWMTTGADLDGRMRIRYGRVDMGAYEFIYSGSFYTVH